MSLYDQYQESAEFIRQQHKGDMPKVAVVLGSGLGSFADAVEDATIIPFEDIPNFPKPLVWGHAGRLLIGKMNGTTIACLHGRVHGYEGHSADKLSYATLTMWALGVETIVLTNAAGSLDQEAGPGSLMAITDHINFSGINPLVGVNDDRIGERFTDVTAAWDKAHLATLKETASELDIKLHEGVYLMAKGPNFETPAEIRAFRTWGANAVGMSTVPECLAARHAGMRVVGVSSITNYAAGMTGEELTHDETMEYGAKAAVNLTKLLEKFVSKIG